MFQGCSGGVPGCSGCVPGVFWGVPGVFRGVPGCSGFYRHPLRKGKSLALKLYDTFDKSFVKNPAECLFSSGYVIVCNFELFPHV